MAHPAFQNLFRADRGSSRRSGHSWRTRRRDPPTRRRSGRRTWRRRGEAAGVVIRDRPRPLPRRGRSARSPVSVIDGRPSQQVGAVLDPIFQPPLPGPARPGATATRSSPPSWPSHQTSWTSDKYRESATFERAHDPGVDAGPRSSSITWGSTRRAPHLPAAGNRIIFSDRRSGGPKPCWPPNQREPGAVGPGSRVTAIVLVRITRRRISRSSPAPPPHRVLAPQAPRRRPRDPERARRHLRRGAPRHAEPSSGLASHPDPEAPGVRGDHPAGDQLSATTHAPPGAHGPSS